MCILIQVNFLDELLTLSQHSENLSVQELSPLSCGPTNRRLGADSYVSTPTFFENKHGELFYDIPCMLRYNLVSQ